MSTRSKLPTGSSEARMTPDTSRIVLCEMADGSSVRAFYWRPENRWYREHGSKKKSQAIQPLRWSEIDTSSNDRET